MSRTLFWYIFKDLLKIFMMSSGALAGIMSFGGLLRPLTQNGLDGPQVALLLANFMPAMSTYSLPVAALFATTWVYGRMGADNEVTACRASGVSYLTLTLPAFVLGLIVAGASLYLLCFTVPRATLRVEQVVYSNLAKLIAHEIAQTHQTQFDTWTVFARDATLPPVAADNPREQAVLLRGPLIVSYACPPGRPRWYQQAKDFWSSSEAVAYIDENPDDGSATLRVSLTNGVVFPRTVAGPTAKQGGAATAEFGPVSIPSRVGEKTKFLDVFKLKQLQRDPSGGQGVQQVLSQFIRADQAAAVASRVAADLRRPAGRAVLRSGDDTLTLAVPPGAIVDAPAAAAGVLTITTARAAGGVIRFRQESGGQVRLTAEGPTCRVAVTVADGQNAAAEVSIDMRDALVDAGDTAGPGFEADTPAPAPVARRFAVALPADVAAMRSRTAEQYLAAAPAGPRLAREQDRLRFAWYDLVDHIGGELNARAAFVVSCLLLVLVGSSLGMMFRSGNFLTAFAVSVVPAMLSTVLIVTGQHTAESTPEVITAANNPLALGVALIWSGNVVTAVAAAILLARLQRR